MALTLPSSKGGIRTFNEAGQVIQDSTNDSIELFVSLHVNATTVIEGTTTIHDDLIVDGTTVISGSTTIHDDLTIDGDTTIGGDLDITANLTVSGTTSLGGTLSLDGPLDATGQTITGGTFNGAELIGVEVTADFVHADFGVFVSLRGDTFGVGVTPRGAFGLAASATDLPTVIALANSLASMATAFGLA